MDVLAVTDFPDVRCKSLIQSANDGSVLIIPREGGYLVRLYVELTWVQCPYALRATNFRSAGEMGLGRCDHLIDFAPYGKCTADQAI